MQIFLFFSLFIAILAVAFAVQNTAQVTVTFLLWKFQGSLALVLLIALATGALISFFASLPALVKNKLVIRGHRKKVTEMEGNLGSYKARLEEAEKKLQDHEQPKQAGTQPPETSN